MLNKIFCRKFTSSLLTLSIIGFTGLTNFNAFASEIYLLENIENLQLQNELEFNVENDDSSVVINPVHGFQLISEQDNSVIISVTSFEALKAAAQLATDYSESIVSVRLDSDICLEETIVMSGNINLIVESHNITITRGANNLEDMLVFDSECNSNVEVISGSLVIDGSSRSQAQTSGSIIQNSGLLSLNGNISLRNNQLTLAGSYGAAIWNDGTIQMQGISISNNSACFGAGIFNENMLTISECLFENNVAYIDSPIQSTGGAIYNNPNSSIILENSTFRQNQADWAPCVFNHENVHCQANNINVE